MKLNIAFCVLSTMIFIIGCESESSSNVDNRIVHIEGNVGSYSELYQKEIDAFTILYINNWLHTYLIDRNTIDSIGQFNLTLTPIPDNILHRAKDDFRKHITISDTSALISYPIDYQTILSEHSIYSISLVGDINSNGSLNRFIRLTYSTKDVSLIGIDSIVDNISQDKYLTVYDYNIYLKKGWNKVVYQRVPISTSPDYITSYAKKYVDDNIIGKWFVEKLPPVLPPNQALKLTWRSRLKNVSSVVK